MSAMIISSIETAILDVPLRRPHKFSILTINSQSLLLVRVTTTDGIMGIGEGVVPGGPWWGGESIEGMKILIDRYLAPFLVGKDVSRVSHLARTLDHMVSGAEFAKSAVEMALWDVCGKSYDLPVYQLLGGFHRDRLPVTWALGAETADVVIEEARKKLDAGEHRSFKLKMGSDRPADDVARVTSVAQALVGDADLAVDLNGSWDVLTAERYLPELAAAGVGLIEQPVPRWDVRSMARLADLLTIPVMADESLRTAHDAAHLCTTGGADVLAVKLAKSGGISNTLTVGAVADSFGVPCYGGTTIESSIGTAASLHVFCAMPSLTAGTELFGPMLLSDDIVVDPVVFKNGLLHLPSGPGLGVELDEQKVARYARA
ncbi:chloromuconate cycloisomerase [Rhodococcus sp. WS3]|uniref:muconate cycloisomerase family protein n=1 Tax=unclassified Rhodococcus (in: high G+C Gram-positive bacteria) TaxID=192944 RepID=UPI001142754D|nr:MULTISPECIES: muconate cycloisomerase family protein [unclassified Rhodococcus (in: high G+C Gram-positive bacteria)]ROZ42803.1 chloromuconate cycloisomerase [Rhodococcus sp. WS3]RZL20874.1 MAG: chloromuconate cycloisomerase [Rhodococcus sp. (in: high G+C Gram-positive bacteria)]